MTKKSRFSADLAIFVPILTGGGAEHVAVRLANGLLAEGKRVDIVYANQDGAYNDEIDEGVNLVDLRSRLKYSLFPFIGYLRGHRPRRVLSFLRQANLLSILAREVTRLSQRLVISERNMVSTQIGSSTLWWEKTFPFLMKRLYPRADAIVAVSRAVANDLGQVLGTGTSRIHVINNPLPLDYIRMAADNLPSHKWFAGKSAPIVLGVGRLVPQKDFASLIRAFALVRAKRKTRLVILGEGSMRAELQELCQSLNVAQDVDFPGFVANPYSYMRRADALVSSSLFEGWTNAIIEALSVGCPVVATNSLGGVAEILDEGRFGHLVPVGDVDRLAEAILETLDHPPARSVLERRAERWDLPIILDSWREVLEI